MHYVCLSVYYRAQGRLGPGQIELTLGQKRPLRETGTIGVYVELEEIGQPSTLLLYPAGLHRLTNGVQINELVKLHTGPIGRGLQLVGPENFRPRLPQHRTDRDEVGGGL